MCSILSAVLSILRKAACSSGTQTTHSTLSVAAHSSFRGAVLSPCSSLRGSACSLLGSAVWISHVLIRIGRHQAINVICTHDFRGNMHNTCRPLEKSYSSHSGAVCSTLGEVCATPLEGLNSAPLQGLHTPFRVAACSSFRGDVQSMMSPQRCCMELLYANMNKDVSGNVWAFVHRTLQS